MQVNIQNIYIDTYYFQGYLWDEKKDRRDDAIAQISKIKYDVRRHGINVKIPFIIVGELMNNLVKTGFERTKREEIMSDFLGLKDKLKADIIPPNKHFYAKAKLLCSCDPYLIEHAPTDCFIALCALCDPYSTYLVIHDTLIVESRSLRDIEHYMRKKRERFQKLHITYSYV